MKNKIAIALVLLAVLVVAAYAQSVWPVKGVGITPKNLDKGSRMQIITARVSLPAQLGSAAVDSMVVFRALIPGIVQNFVLTLDTATTDTAAAVSASDVGSDSILIRKSSWAGTLYKLGGTNTRRILGKGDSLRLSYPVLIPGTDTSSLRRVATADLIWYKVRAVGTTTAALPAGTLQFEFYAGDNE